MTEIDASFLQELCESLRKEFGVTGASLAVIQDGRMSTAAAGTANAALGEPMRPETLIQIGSTTKVYTAALMLQLADVGALDIDRPVAEILPGIALASDEEAGTITPRHLMSMMSGLENGPYADTGRGGDCVERYVELLAELPLLFAPGTAFSYSNASTIVSGLVIERLTGLCWDDALSRLLLEPAGLRDSISLADRLPYRHVAVGHEPGLDGRVVAQDWTMGRGMGPAGSTLATTASDLARFGLLMLDGGLAADGTRILSEDSVALMHAPQMPVPARWFADDWCVGPYRKLWGGVEVFGHGGTTPQASSTLNWIPSRGVAVAIIVNNPSLGYPFADAVLGELAGSRLGIDKPARPTADLAIDIDPSLYLGEYSGSGEYEVYSREGGLGLRMTASASGGTEVVDSALLPIGDHRFLAEDDGVTSFHNWDVAFSGFASGQAALFHNGAFAAARRRR